MKDEAPPPPEALEAMARGIYESQPGLFWDRVNVSNRADCIEAARAALTALREAGYAVVPRVATPGMMIVGANLQFGYAGRLMLADGNIVDHSEDKRISADQVSRFWTAMLEEAER